MGLYINKGNEGFRRIRNSEYVDKTELIRVVNSTLFTENCFTCVSRCRRFGKSMAAKMLAAYYDCTCDSRSLFAGLEAEQDVSFEKHLNKYPVLYLDMTSFITRFKGDDNIVSHIDREVRADVYATYP
ncbi:MAG: AAA family ATPase, partial [Prevotella sp.]|nr:AAA family ATPase [Prevotella sp.]